jgi:5-methylcytosine-specific restriction endonuclease McrA
MALSRTDQARAWPSRNKPCKGCGKPTRAGRCYTCKGKEERELIPCPRCGAQFWPWYDGGHARLRCQPCTAALKAAASERRTAQEARRLSRRINHSTPEELAERDRVKARRYYAAHRAASVARVQAYKRANPDRNRDWGHRRRTKLREGFIAPVDMAAIMSSRKSCTYCGRRLNASIASVDHIVPIARGGAHAAFNLVPACRSCNSRKGDRPIVEWITMLPTRRRARVERLCKQRNIAQANLPLRVPPPMPWDLCRRSPRAGQTGANFPQISGAIRANL